MTTLPPGDPPFSQAEGGEEVDYIEVHLRTIETLVRESADEVFARLESVKGRSLRAMMEAVEVSDMVGADLSHARLRRQILKGIDFSRANLTGADLRDCDLRGCDFRNAAIERVRWEGADLGGALFDAAVKAGVERAAKRHAPGKQPVKAFKFKPEDTAGAAAEAGALSGEHSRAGQRVRAGTTVRFRP